MKLLRLLLLALVAIPATAPAQCGFDGLHRYRLRTDSAYAAAAREHGEGWIACQAAQSAAKLILTPPDTSYEVPVMIHIMHNGEAPGTIYNPADTQLISWIAYTNAAYDASWPGYASMANGGVRTRIRFVLARNDGRCHPIPTAIFRVDASSVPGYKASGIHYPGSSGGGAPEAAVTALSPAPADCLNIWIVNRIDSNTVAGYAAYFGNNVFVVISQAVAGNSLLPHEIGHALGLYHTFEGDNDGTVCPPATNCATTGDMICDTEPDKRYPNCTAATNPCTGLPYGSVRRNFMNYSRCSPDRFTAGQRDEMRYTLRNAWYGASSVAGDSIRVLPPMTAARCTATHPVPFDPAAAIAGPVLVTFNDIYHKSGSCREDSVYADYTCAYRTGVRPGATYTLGVMVAGRVQNIRAYLDYNNDGDFQVPAEQIMSVDKAVGTPVAAVTIPASGVVLNKPLRLRVVSDDLQNTTISPCGVLIYGQAEDYAVTVMAATAVQAGSMPQCTVAPNPAADMINLSFDRPFRGRVALYNSVGQCVYTASVAAQPAHAIPGAGLAAGIYSLVLQSHTGETRVMKAVIVH